LLVTAIIPSSLILFTLISEHSILQILTGLPQNALQKEVNTMHKLKNHELSDCRNTIASEGQPAHTPQERRIYGFIHTTQEGTATVC
jgi:hypothetical protein